VIASSPQKQRQPSPAFATVFLVLAPLGCNCTPTPEPEITARPPVVRPNPDADVAPSSLPERLRVAVHARHPHDRDAFTQGLLYTNGRLFESTGREGHSSVREVDLETGRVLRRRDNGPEIFAEGLALIEEELVQLSWQNGLAFVYRRDDFSPLRQHTYDTEGWGLCFDGKSLVMSDGTARLFFRDPRTFAVQRVASVWRDSKPVRHLNELECVGDHVYANVWGTDEIVRVRASDGVVDGTIDASGLLSAAESRDVDVLNGIAFMPDRGRFLVTGKLWPAIFEVTFEPR
jgi:glutaminyl-peptide cyclotransferase